MTLAGPQASGPPLVLLSEAKDLVPVASSGEVLRYAKDDRYEHERARGPRSGKMLNP